MNKYPYRKKRKGKRPPRSNDGENSILNNTSTSKNGSSEHASFEYSAAGERSAKPHQHTGDVQQHTQKTPNKRDGETANVNGAPQPKLRGRKPNGGPAKQHRNNLNGGIESAVEIDHAQHGFDEGDNLHQQSNARGESKQKRNASSGEQFLRNLRAPVKPIPIVSYDPKKPDHVSKHGSKAHSGFNEQGRKKGAKHGSRKNSFNNRCYAALDLGTNNCRLLVAVPQEKGRFRVIDGYSKIVRLGEGLGHSGSLRQDAMDRSIAALKVCADKLSHYNVKRQRLIATEACRQADNGEEFLRRVKQETGLELEIINRETEASLAAEGCGALMDRKADAGVLFDIGGGSSELMLVNRRLSTKRISDQIVSWHSLPVGVVTLSERFGGEHVTRDSFRAMVADVLEMLKDFEGKDGLARIWKNGRVHLLGTSGTVTTLAGIHLNLPRYDRRKVDGLWLQDNEIEAVLETLLSMDYKQRAASPCIGKERADLVMAGCAILEAIRLTWPAKRLRVADRGLREGVLTQLMDRDGAWIKRKKDRWPRKRTNQKDNSKSGGHLER